MPPPLLRKIVMEKFVRKPGMYREVKATGHGPALPCKIGL